MSRINFGWCFLENVEELLLSVFLYAWARACVRSSHSCVCSSVHAYAGMFLRFCVRGNEPMYAESCSRMWALICVRETPGRSLALPLFTYFSPVSLPYAMLTPFFSFMHLNVTTSFFLPSFMYHNTIFFEFHLNHESNDISSFFEVIIPFCW